ncbi:MAG: GGDEF domain-containing protein [Desulfobacteraceae bacterium]|nr:MAG: GGDEF domain-containing protein [Desulfobacteraceae bacterium]
MKDKNIWEIIYLCVAINQKAIQVYTKLFEVEEIKELKVFWNRMADEEKIRAAFWDRTKETIKGYTLSGIFNDPAQTKYELTTLLEKIDVLLDRWEDKKVMENALILAYRLEYYMLHPTFEMLFRALKPLANGLDSSDTYDLHIQEFINMFVRYGDITPELELLGETLQSLWQRNKDLAEIAMVDGLTGLLNRRGFLVIAHELFFLAQRKKENVAIFMTDIDHFKKINDQYGHPKGDAVLRGVAKSLKSSIRKSDVLSRYGGEEFVILFPHILSSAVPNMAEKLRKGVEEARPEGIFVSISIGVEQGIVKNASDKTFFAWISKADEHLYKAKANGRNCVVSGR